MSLEVAYYQHERLLQFWLLSVHVCYICTRPSAMSVTIASDHLPCLSQLHLTSSHICETCTYKQVCLINLHLTSIHICFSNIQPSVLSVELATDQYSSNDCYNCTIYLACTNQQSRWKRPSAACRYMYLKLLRGCFCDDTLHSTSTFFFFYL